MVRMPEINLAIDLGMAWNIQQVRDTGKGVAVFCHDLVESSEANAKTEWPIFFADEEDRSNVSREGGTDETHCGVLI